MKLLIVSLLTVLACACCSAASACKSCSPKADVSVAIPHPSGCTLSSAGLADRVTEVSLVLARREEVRELEDGFTFRFPGDEHDLVAQLAAWVVAERQCCTFLGLELKLMPDQGPVWLTLRGSHDVKKLVASLLETSANSATHTREENHDPEP